MKLAMEGIIYQTKVFSKWNTYNAICLALIVLITIAGTITAVDFDITTDYPEILFLLAFILLYIMYQFKKITLTECEFIVEYPFIFKPKVRLNDIEKLVFSDSPKEFKSIEIYRISSGWNTKYDFYTDYDDLKRLFDGLRNKGIQVDCIGFKKPYLEWNTLEPKKAPFLFRKQ